MSHAILISNNIILNDLYSLNLKAYVDTNVTIKEDLSEALKLIEMKPHIDLVVCTSTIDGEDVIEKLISTLKASEIDVPIIAIGEEVKVSDWEVYFLPPFLNVNKFVKTAGEALGVTARMMVDKIVPEYYPIPIRLFRSFSKTPCEIFHLISKGSREKEYSKIIDKDGEIREKVTKYIELGVECFFVYSHDRLKVVNEISNSIVNRLDDKSLSSEEKAIAVETGFEVVASQMSGNDEMTESMVQISKKCVENIKDMIKEVPKIRHMLKMLMDNKSSYVYQHNILGTYVARHILENIEWGSEEHAEKLGFTFFFHDIFLMPIFTKYPDIKNEEDLFFSEKLSEKEKDLVLNHARLAGEIVKTFPRCPMGADAIITQHHGTSAGVGIAVDFKDDISPLAKVMIISEEFVNEMFKQKESGNKKYNLDDILDILYDKFTRHTYKRILKTLETIQV
jgi:response regulator RpfG family c-di-GMP phosphodiesterase